MTPEVPYLVDNSSEIPRPLKKITKEEKEHFNSLSIILNEFGYFKKRMFEIKLNLVAYDFSVRSYKELFKKRPIGEPVEESENNQMYVEINRNFINYITSIKSFVEHCENRLEKEFGCNSSEFMEFKSCVSKIYDDHFVYRFFSRLRDYAVHVYYPIDHFFSDSDLLNENLKTYSYELTPQFSREKLKDNTTLRKKLKNDLDEFDMYFEVQPLILEMGPLIERIYSLFLNLMSVHFLPIAKEIISLKKKFKKSRLAISILHVESTEIARFNTELIPLELAEELLLRLES